MRKLAFFVTDETREYCDAVVWCLVEYGKKDHENAVELVNQYWKDEPSFEDDDFRQHEPPYFWAMCIIHDPVLGDNYPSWWDDPKFWPPPTEACDLW